jgi:hypothetical protein
MAEAGLSLRVCLPVYPAIHPPIYLPTYLPTYLSIDQPTNPPMYTTHIYIHF